MSDHPFWTYTRMVLGFRLGKGDGGYATTPLRPQVFGPVLRQARRAGHLLLLGLGAGRVAGALAEALPPEVGLTVCDLSPDQARSVSLPWLSPQGRAQLLADASPTALACLLLSTGLLPGRTACVLNPEVADPGARAGLKTLQTLWSGFTPLALPENPALPSLSIAAILHPEEPDLEGFFAALPSWALEVVVVWDGEVVPDRLPPSALAARHLAHPLERDFAAQRNRMLAACRGDWVLYLDGDERLSPELSGLLPALTAQAECPAWALPRLALSGNGVKAGFGLWPDLQVRLFRRLPQVRFVRPVHERLAGLPGPLGLALGAPILHLSDLLKDASALERKLALFDAAGGRDGLHRRSAEYPALPRSYFSALSAHPVAGLWPESIGL